VTVAGRDTAPPSTPGAIPFRSARVGSATLVAAPTLFDALAQRLEAFETLYAWAEAQPQPRALQGRAVVYVAEITEHATSVVVRHAWHGGLFAPLTGDRFLVPTRAPREAAVNVLLRARGVPTPELLGYALYPAGPGLRRVDVLSRYVPDAADFGAVLLDSLPGLATESAVRAVVRLLAALAEARAVHPDLNVKNVLLCPGSPASAQAMVLDVDVVRFRDIPAAAVMAINVRRLVRSIRKWFRMHDRPVDEMWLSGFVTSAMAAT
jgi:tRNA A-37 threonylcarbamoyl transferase component Bud32